MSLIDRAKNIILQPKQEWQVIDGEASTIGSIYSGYVVPLSAIPVLALAIRRLAYAPTFGPFVARPSAGHVVGYAVLQYILGLVAIYIVGLIIDVLAPTFGGTKNPLQAFKVAAYSYTPWWVGSIALIIPWIGPLIALCFAFYSIYVLYLGLPALMKGPADKAVVYTIAIIVVAFVLFLIIGMIVGAVFAATSGIAGM